MSSDEARMRSYLAACSRVLSDRDREHGLSDLRVMAMEGFTPAILALAEELVRKEAPHIPERPEDWALAAFALRHIAPLERLLARRSLAGEDTLTLAARRDRQLARDPQRSQHIESDASVREAISLVEAGEPHREFGLERLHKLARQGIVSAGLAYAEELVANAPPSKRAARAGWAESAAILGHHAPILRLISLLEREGDLEQAAELRARHEAILITNLATEITVERTPAANPAEREDAGFSAASQAEVKQHEGRSGASSAENIAAIPGATAHAAQKRSDQQTAERQTQEAGDANHSPVSYPPNGQAKTSPYCPLHVLLVLLLFGGIALLSPGTRHWLFETLKADLPNETSEAPVAVADTPLGLGSTSPTASGTALREGVTSLSPSAASYLDKKIATAEAQAETLMQAGREKQAEDAIVAAIEAAMIAGDLDKLERLLDRQVQTIQAIEEAKVYDKETIGILKRIIGYIEKGFDFSLPPREGYWNREYIHYWSPDAQEDRLQIACNIKVSQGGKRGHPERLFKDLHLTDKIVDIDLAALYNTRIQSISGVASMHDFIGDCPDHVLYYKKMLIGFCGGNADVFHDQLGNYLRRAGCVTPETK